PGATRPPGAHPPAGRTDRGGHAVNASGSLGQTFGLCPEDPVRASRGLSGKMPAYHEECLNYHLIRCIEDSSSFRSSASPEVPGLNLSVLTSRQSSFTSLSSWRYFSRLTRVPTSFTSATYARPKIDENAWYPLVLLSIMPAPAKSQ